MKKMRLAIVFVLLASGIVWANANAHTRKVGNIKITCLDLGQHMANCYVVSSTNKEAYVIDPGGNAPAIIEHLKTQQLNVKGYLISHGHGDHIKALPQLLKMMPAPAGIHAADIPFYTKKTGSTDSFELLFEEDKTYGTGDLTFTIIHTPGHTPGGVCFYFKQANVLFSGDTLFEDAIGRTDFYGGSASQLQASLERLTKLPPKTVVFPGHGESTVREDELP